MKAAGTIRGRSAGPVELILNYRRILSATTRVELAKRYSGSLFGKAWILLYPALLLSMYLFVYSVYGMHFPGSSRMSYVIYVFSGLIPYIGFMEAVTSGCVAIKQNIHLIKNVLLPIELVPVRYVFMSTVTELFSLFFLLGLITWNRSLGWQLIGLPMAVMLQAVMLVGLLWFIAPLAVALPDISYFVNLIVMLLMFISPIGFQPQMVPQIFRFALYLNPIFYMTESYRGTLIPGYSVPRFVFIAYTVGSVTVFIAGSVFFQRFKKVIADYE